MCCRVLVFLDQWVADRNDESFLRFDPVSTANVARESFTTSRYFSIIPDMLTFRCK